MPNPLALFSVILILLGCSDGLLDFGAGGGGGGGGGGSGISAAPNGTVTVIEVDTGNGMIYIGGDFTSIGNVARGRVARIHPDGSLDTEFKVTTGASSQVRGLSLSNNGLYVVGLFESFDNGTHARIVRLNTSTGAVDGTFNSGTGFTSDVNAVLHARDISNGVYVTGAFTSYNGTALVGLARLQTNGLVDISFTPGIVNGFGLDLHQENSGDFLVYVAGSIDSYAGSERNEAFAVQTNGAIDNTFLTSSVGGFNFFVHAITSHGTDLAAGGLFTFAQNTTTGKFVITQKNATARQNFDPGIQNGQVFDIAVPALGTIYAAGSFTSFAGGVRNSIIRLNSGGAEDAGFTVGTGFNNDARAIAVVSNNQVLVGGAFTTYQGQSAPFLARLNSNGTLDTSFIAP